MIKDIVEKAWFRHTVVLLIGISVGAIFYPTKRIEERVAEKYEEQIKTLKQRQEQETRALREEKENVSKELVNYKKETETKLNKNLEEIRDLKKKQKTSYFKIVKPDGTIEIRRFSESEETESTKIVEQIKQEFKEKLDSTEEKWKKIHEERVELLVHSFQEQESNYLSKIKELEKQKTISINAKKISIDAGLLSTKDYYGHATVDFWGPLVIGIHGQVGTQEAFGAGIGIRF